QRYPQVTLAEIQAAQPDLILLSSEPFPFKEKHQNQLKNWLPQSRSILVDGELFSWYGSRLLKAVPYFRSLWEQINSNL
ncbi:MAG: helical backbone metal receptor, partial [Bacteroidota bacterium]